MSQANLSLKQGDTLIADCTYRDANGDAVDLDAAGITITSAVVMPDGIERFELEVTLRDQATQPGEYRIRGDTSAWQVGCVAKWDIRYNRGGDSFSSRTLTILVLPSIT